MNEADARDDGVPADKIEEMPTLLEKALKKVVALASVSEIGPWPS